MTYKVIPVTEEEVKALCDEHWIYFPGKKLFKAHAIKTKKLNKIVTKEFITINRIWKDFIPKPSILVPASFPPGVWANAYLYEELLIILRAINKIDLATKTNLRRYFGLEKENMDISIRKLRLKLLKELEDA